VEGRAELGEGVRALGEEHAVAIHIEFERQTVFGEGGGEEVQISEQVFPVVDGGPRANPGAIIQKVQQRIISRVAGKPAMWRGIELPEGSDLEALPAAGGSGRAGLGNGWPK